MATIFDKLVNENFDFMGYNFDYFFDEEADKFVLFINDDKVGVVAMKYFDTRIDTSYITPEMVKRWISE